MSCATCAGLPPCQQGTKNRVTTHLRVLEDGRIPWKRLRLVEAHTVKVGVVRAPLDKRTAAHALRRLLAVAQLRGQLGGGACGLDKLRTSRHNAMEGVRATNAPSAQMRTRPLNWRPSEQCTIHRPAALSNTALETSVCRRACFSHGRLMWGIARGAADLETGRAAGRIVRKRVTRAFSNRLAPLRCAQRAMRWSRFSRFTAQHAAWPSFSLEAPAQGGAQCITL